MNIIPVVVDVVEEVVSDVAGCFVNRKEEKRKKAFSDVMLYWFYRNYDKFERLSHS